MKISNITPAAPPRFEPVHITLVFETREELAAIGRLFNSGPVCAALRKIGVENPGILYPAFEETGVDISTNGLNEILFAELKSFGQP